MAHRAATLASTALAFAANAAALAGAALANCRSLALVAAAAARLASFFFLVSMGSDDS
jgi:hypothetical protein